MQETKTTDYDDMDWVNNGQKHEATNFVEVELTCTSDPKKSLGRVKLALHDANFDTLLSNVGKAFKSPKNGNPIGEPVAASSGTTRRAATTRRSSGGSSPRARSGSRTNDATRERNKRIRAWADTQPEWRGQVSDSGRLPNNLIEAYNISHPDDQEPAAAPEQATEVEQPEPQGSNAEPEPVAASTGAHAAQNWSGSPSAFTGVG